ncbi:unnamed protein product [Nyctereutes procyonoides]|uniref:Exocyst complex component 5 n=1 Tax=Nyctereutes procyonoides TaxID=34880 RepID=A0A811Y8B0_NYCPR|nr:unnamed protein product [Nyctereutes procyonoides]
MTTTAELLEGPFVADEYIEQLVWRTPGGCSRGRPEAFDPKRAPEKQSGCLPTFPELDEHIIYEATKVFHLGDQLEGVNTSRQGVVESPKLMKYFGELKSDKLHLIDQELPFDRFSEEKSKIEFTSAQRKGEISRMREVAAVLLYFRGYSHCADVYIKHCKQTSADILILLLLLLLLFNLPTYSITPSNPEIVLAKLTQNVFEATNLSSKLMQFNIVVINILSCLRLSNPFSFPIWRTILSFSYLETGYLKSRSAMILQCCYDSKKHQKRSIGTRAIDTHEETFLSQVVVVNLLQETKQAFERCPRLSDTSDLTRNAFRILSFLWNFYESNFLFFGCSIFWMLQANTIFQLFNKQFNDHLMISSSKTLNFMIGQMKHILAAEQKKTDLKPEDENNVLIQYTNALENIRNAMDGKNMNTVLMELGVHFHLLGGIFVFLIFMFGVFLFGCFVLFCFESGHTMCVQGRNRAHALRFCQVILTLVTVKV